MGEFPHSFTRGGPKLNGLDWGKSAFGDEGSSDWQHLGLHLERHETSNILNVLNLG